MADRLAVTVKLANLLTWVMANRLTDTVSVSKQ